MQFSTLPLLSVSILFASTVASAAMEVYRTDENPCTKKINEMVGAAVPARLSEIQRNPPNYESCQSALRADVDGLIKNCKQHLRLSLSEYLDMLQQDVEEKLESTGEKNRNFRRRLNRCLELSQIDCDRLTHELGERVGKLSVREDSESQEVEDALKAAKAEFSLYSHFKIFPKNSHEERYLCPRQAIQKLAEGINDGSKSKLFSVLDMQSMIDGKFSEDDIDRMLTPDAIVSQPANGNGPSSSSRTSRPVSGTGAPVLDPVEPTTVLPPQSSPK